MENYIWMNRLNVLSQSLKKYDVAMKLKIINKRRFNDKWIKIIKKIHLLYLVFLKLNHNYSTPFSKMLLNPCF